MIFLPFICLGLAILFTVKAVRENNKNARLFAVCLYIAALGTGVITYFALTVVK